MANDSRKCIDQLHNKGTKVKVFMRWSRTSQGFWESYTVGLQMNKQPTNKQQKW